MIHISNTSLQHIVTVEDIIQKCMNMFSFPPSILLSFLPLELLGIFHLQHIPILDCACTFQSARCQMWPRLPSWMVQNVEHRALWSSEENLDFILNGIRSLWRVESWGKVCVCWGRGWGLGGEVTWFHLISLNHHSIDGFIKDEWLYTWLKENISWSISLIKLNLFLTSSAS